MPMSDIAELPKIMGEYQGDVQISKNSQLAFISGRS